MVTGNSYGSATGTGTASAHAAGAAAMILEWGIVRKNLPTLTGYDISRMFMRAARHGASTTYPNNLWGYGQLDVNKVFQQLTNL
ncbi:MAG: hypothetical protein E7249_05155 [Paenibacillaceae bacterium]|nr:hypothetical protein [Paenibacillaceae bacterium]